MEIIASQLRGLSDQTRIRILNILIDGELCVCDIIFILNIPQSTVSRHLAYLRKTGWIEARRDGKWLHYRRPLHTTPLQAYAFAMLDDELSTNAQAKNDKTALFDRLNEKSGGLLVPR
jgi:ArsR family transcriptional regulator